MSVITETNRRWWVTVAMSLVMVLLTLDFFGLAVCLPRIGEDLQASTGTLLWTMNGYLLAFSAPIIAMGRLADIRGRRKVLLFGTVVFVIGSMLCGLAQSAEWLIVARVLQGIGGGTIFATALSIVSNAFPSEQRALGIGIWSGVGLVGSAVGPFVAGFLTQLASWRWYFFLNVPVGIAAILLTLVAVNESRDETFTGRVDVKGFAALSTGFVFLTFGLQESAQYGWGSPLVLGTLVVAILVLGLFVWIERHVEDPLVEFSLFGNVRFAGACGVAFFGNWTFGTILFFLTLYFQEIRDLDPITTGMIFLVFTIPLVIMSPVGGKLQPRVGVNRLMAIGMALVSAGILCFAFIAPGAGWILIVSGLLLAGLGQGFAYPMSQDAGIEAMPEEKAGIASGVLSSARLMGIVVGLALSGTVFRSLESSELIVAAGRAGTKLDAAGVAEVRGLLAGSDAAQHALSRMAADLAGTVETVVDEAFLAGMRWVMIVALAVSIIGIPLSLIGRRENAVMRADVEATAGSG